MGERPRFDPWVGMIPWRRERLPTPVFWPGELHGLYSSCSHKELDTNERLSLHTHTHTHTHTYNNLRKVSFVAQLIKKSACNVGDMDSIPGLG